MSNNYGCLLPAAPASRRNIPFYHDKTEAEFKADVYERYDEFVTRQTALHLADGLHGGYPYQPLQDYLSAHLPTGEHLAVADVGCSVGRLIGDLAAGNPTWDAYGIDLSYQMLRQARDYWVTGKTLQTNLINYGWGTPLLPGHRLPNLHFALARAERLPFPDDSLDLLLNTFLIDRLPGPYAAFAEWKRILKPGGKLIAVSPLNYLRPDSWRTAHPPVKILAHLQANNWRVDDWKDPFPLAEPMDARGNVVTWNCVAFVLSPS